MLESCSILPEVKTFIVVFQIITHSSRSLNGRWGIKDDRTTTFLNSSLPSAFQRASFNPNPVHSDIYIYDLPISFSVYLSFSLLVPCLVGSSSQDLLIFLCAHIISICVFSQWCLRYSYSPMACQWSYFLHL